MGTISKNFSFKEFEHSDSAEKAHINNVITTTEVRDAIKALVLQVLQPLRDSLGEPLVLNSGYRCRELNSLVGGVPTSQHVKGEAADIRSSNPLHLAQTINNLDLPFDQMILYPNFVHVSHKRVGSQRRQILYNWRYKGERVQ